MQRPSRRRRIALSLLLGALVLGVLYLWDGSRQPVSGNGWRILLAQRALGTLNSVAVINDQAELDAAWDTLRALGAARRLDFDRQLVV